MQNDDFEDRVLEAAHQRFLRDMKEADERRTRDAQFHMFALSVCVLVPTFLMLSGLAVEAIQEHKVELVMGFIRFFTGM